MNAPLSPQDLLQLLKNRKLTRLIDVRSEKEFEEGSIPHSVNLPILNNEERHLVGIEYKQKGQESAIHLGHLLVDPHREARVQSWLTHLDTKTALTCWRGGLRSKTASQWIQERGLEVLRVQGGYKSIRRHLLSILDQPPGLVVIGGWTGSGKTLLLQRISQCRLGLAKLDLEGLAKHRGSCFGERISATGTVLSQPSQTTFENYIGFELLGEKLVFVEDESTRIGHLNLPKTLKEKIKTSPLIFVEASADERASHIYHEYIAEPICLGVSVESVRDFFLQRLVFLKRHLGGLVYDEFRQEIENAFLETHALGESLILNPAPHQKWIKRLLIQHYDPSYQYAFNRLKRDILFRGHLEDCLHYLQQTTYESNESSAISPK